jgi:hypothetical protein
MDDTEDLFSKKICQADKRRMLSSKELTLLNPIVWPPLCQHHDQRMISDNQDEVSKVLYNLSSSILHTVSSDFDTNTQDEGPRVLHTVSSDFETNNFPFIQDWRQNFPCSKYFPEMTEDQGRIIAKEIGQGASHKQTVLYHRRHLLTLYHASLPECNSEIFENFIEIQALWSHLKGCNDDLCSFKECLLSRYLLAHYKVCQDFILLSNLDCYSVYTYELKLQTFVHILIFSYMPEILSEIMSQFF